MVTLCFSGLVLSWSVLANMSYLFTTHAHAHMPVESNEVPKNWHFIIGVFLRFCHWLIARGLSKWKPELFKHNVEGRTVFISCSVRWFDGYLGRTISAYIKSNMKHVFEKHSAKKASISKRRSYVRLPVSFPSYSPGFCLTWNMKCLLNANLMLAWWYVEGI